MAGSLFRLLEASVRAVEKLLLSVVEKLTAYLIELCSESFACILHFRQPCLEGPFPLLLSGGETRAFDLGVGAGLARLVELLLHSGKVGDRLAEILGTVVAFLAVERGLAGAEKPAGGGARNQGNDNEQDKRGVHVAPLERRANLSQVQEMVKSGPREAVENSARSITPGSIRRP